jgi:hypothetical protein
MPVQNQLPHRKSLINDCAFVAVVRTARFFRLTAVCSSGVSSIVFLVRAVMQLGPGRYAAFFDSRFISRRMS